jgi:hypothetical protein
MARARRIEVRAVVVLIAGLLALTAVWAGSALGGGSGGSGSNTGKAPANKSTPGFVQDNKGDRGSGHDCPFKDRNTGADVAAQL